MNYTFHAAQFYALSNNDFRAHVQYNSNILDIDCKVSGYKASLSGITDTNAIVTVTSTDGRQLSKCTFTILKKHLVYQKSELELDGIIEHIRNVVYNDNHPGQDLLDALSDYKKVFNFRPEEILVSTTRNFSVQLSRTGINSVDVILLSPGGKELHRCSYTSGDANVVDLLIKKIDEYDSRLDRDITKRKQYKDKLEAKNPLTIERLIKSIFDELNIKYHVMKWGEPNGYLRLYSKFCTLYIRVNEQKNKIIIAANHLHATRYIIDGTVEDPSNKVIDNMIRVVKHYICDGDSLLEEVMAK